MSATKFDIGDRVWVARRHGKRCEITCPDCFGTGQLDVTLADGTKHSIECRGCEHGYDPPKGRVLTWDYEPAVEMLNVTGIELRQGEEPEYRCDCWLIKESEVYLTCEEAQARAVVLAKEAEDEERAKISRKEKDTRSWAWNVHYHRAAIRRAEKELAYHTAKLNVAKLRAKEPA